MKGLLASPLGAVIGLLMGTFGGGGSLVAIPVLVFVVGQGTREAQATSLVIVVAASIAGVVSYLRSGDVRWRAGLTFGLAAAASALAGSLLSRALDPDLLLLLFTPVMLVGAYAMVSEAAEDPASFRPWRLGVEVAEVVKVVGLGLGVGLIVGLFGVGGGFVIVPVLVLVLHLSMVEAVGTALVVVIVASSFALGDRIVAGDVEWAVAIPFSVAALAGSLAGKRVAKRFEGPNLRRAFAATIVVAALYTGIDSALAL